MVAREKDKIVMVFDVLDLEPGQEGRCNYDYLRYMGRLFGGIRNVTIVLVYSCGSCKVISSS